MATVTAPLRETTEPTATRPPAAYRKWGRESWKLRAPLLPALIFLIVVTQLPFVATLVMSFMNWSAQPDAPERSFAGFDNFKTVFTTPAYRTAVLNTIEMTVVVVGVSAVLALGIALLLNHAFIGRGLVRTMMIAPFLIVPIAAAVFWGNGILMTGFGLVDGVLGQLGVPGAQDIAFLTDHPKLAIEIELIWQWTPFMMLILLAGLQSQDPEVLEAASIDGCNGWQTFVYMTLPHVRRYLELSIVLGTIFIVQNFDSVLGMTGGLNSTNIPYAVYETFYSAKDYGVASALGVVVVIGSLIIATFALRVVSSLLTDEEASR
ncbi:sugar ABC transporter permease [Nocardioides sp. NBC_00850]|uniref:carbohydrate ABC transporter permease n=1 Tax=Nocardioides sp. NBC_00850 TaxID=2976001 RepID=UPI003869524F|nr:sugar ABC transporter permease [Nocardioides sp. NBC_00850]